MKTVEVIVASDWRRRWPCGRLRAEDCVIAKFTANGGLVDLAIYRAGVAISPPDLEAAELAAVLDDAARA